MQPIVKRCFYSLRLLLVLLVMIPFFAFAYGEILLYDDFSDGSLFNTPESVFNPVWELTAFKGRKHAIVDDGTGNMVYRCAGTRIESGSPDWTDVEIETRFRLISENDVGQNFRLFWINPRYSKEDTSKNYSVEFNYDPGNGFYFSVKRNRDKKELTNVKLGESPYEVFGYDWHTYTIRVIGRKMVAYIDGEEILGSEVTIDEVHSGMLRIYAENLIGTPAVGYMDIDYIKVTEMGPSLIITTPTIPADGKSQSSILVKWLPGAKVRAIAPELVMMDNNNKTIRGDVTIPKLGEATFKVRGKVAGSFPIEVSLDGKDWWVSKADKTLNFVSVADPAKSQVFIPDSESTRYPAAGQVHQVPIKVKITDYDFDEFGPKGRYKVTLKKVGDGPGDISKPTVVTKGQEAEFSIASTKTGVVKIEAQVESVDDTDKPLAAITPVILDDQISIEFVQAINCDNSKIELVDKRTAIINEANLIKVTLRDYENKPIVNVKVDLQAQEGKDYAIVPVANVESKKTQLGVTDPNGNVYFKLTASKPGPITLKATAENLFAKSDLEPQPKLPIRIAKKIWHIFIKPSKTKIDLKLAGNAEGTFEISEGR